MTRRDGYGPGPGSQPAALAGPSGQLSVRDQLARLAARQHPHLTVDASDWQRPVVLGALTLDGVLSAIAGALFLPWYLGAVPFPISGLASGVVNLALVWAACQWTTSARVGALPMWSWLLTVIGLSFGGPGGDIVFGGTGVMQLGPLVLLALGATPPLVFLYRRTRVRV